jgi:hypothetical protein
LWILSAGVEIKYKFMTTQQQKICVYCCGVKRWSCSGIKFDKTYYKQISFAMQIWCLQYLQSFISQFQNGLLLYCIPVNIPLSNDTSDHYWM